MENSNWKNVGTGSLRLLTSNRSFIFIDDFNNVLLTEHLYDFDADSTSCSLCEIVQTKNVKIALHDYSNAGAMKIYLIRLKDEEEASALHASLQQFRNTLKSKRLSAKK